MLSLFIFLASLEILIQFLFKENKKENLILIDNTDYYPLFDKKKFKNFLKNSFNKKLGWERKKNSTGFDLNNKKLIKFSIDRKGHRKIFYTKNKKFFASFGDSYVFGRQVLDKDTWQEQIAKNSNFNILNYGVGNYGFDQSLIKFKNTKLNKEIKYIILGFVPETICRIQSHWKHYLEFGNIHAFKPLFVIRRGKLKLIPNPLNKRTKIKQLKNIIQKIQKIDRFYEEKFQKYIFKFPFFVSFIKNFNFNLKVFIMILLKEFKLIALSKEDFQNILFSYSMKRNILESHKYYNEPKSIELFKKLIEEFKRTTLKKKKIPILLILPQLMDLKLNSKKNYVNFFSTFKNELNVIDTTEFLLKNLNKKIYTNDKYGGHFSKLGNKLISIHIYKNLKKIQKKNESYLQR